MKLYIAYVAVILAILGFQVWMFFAKLHFFMSAP